MQASRIFETVIYAGDLVAAERFYSEVMGLEVYSRSDTVVACHCGDGVLLIFDPERAGLPNRGVPSHGAHGPGHVAFAMRAEEANGWRAHLAAHGVAIEMEIDRHPAGLSLYFRDPAGNSVELAPPTLWGSGRGK